MRVHITSFGYLHTTPPEAHLTLDLRHHFRDPHIDPTLRHLTAHDQPVRQAVINTGGIPELITATAQMALAYEMGPGSDDTNLTIAVGCAGGRHRAATVAMALADVLRHDHCLDTHVVHRDLDKPVVHR